MDESTPYSDDAAEDLPSEGQFLSPEDSRILLADLEAIDTRKLAHSGSNKETVAEASATCDEGSFISPDDALTPMPHGPALEAQNSVESSPAGIPVSELLSRIAKEVQSIKAELGSLRSTQIAETQAQGAAPWPAPVQVPDRPAPVADFPPAVHEDVKRLLAYLDRLLESLPEDKVDEFARSEYFDLYRKVFEYFDLT
jgi:hypothetical protein